MIGFQGITSIYIYIYNYIFIFIYIYIFVYFFVVVMYMLLYAVKEVVSFRGAWSINERGA